MMEVCKRMGEETFARARGNDEDAPIPDLGTLAPEPVVRPKDPMGVWLATVAP
jgi:hypothetical protein